MSESLTKNERMSKSLVLLSESRIRSFFRKKTSDSLRKPMSEFPALAAGYKIYGALCVTETGFGPFSHWKTKKFIITKNYVFLIKSSTDFQMYGDYPFPDNMSVVYLQYRQDSKLFVNFL